MAMFVSASPDRLSCTVVGDRAYGATEAAPVCPPYRLGGGRASPTASAACYAGSITVETVATPREPVSIPSSVIVAVWYVTGPV